MSEKQEKKAEVDLKIAETEESRQRSETEKAKRAFEHARCLTEKIFAIKLMAETSVIDPDRTIVGSEPFLRPLFSDEELETMRQKAIEIINKM